MNNKPGGMDQRNHPRHDASIEVDYATYSPYHVRRITNISRGGLFIRTQDILPVGTEIEISFRLPNHTKPIQSRVRVMWTYRQPASVAMNSSGMGVQFLQIQDDDKAAIQAFITNVSEA